MNRPKSKTKAVFPMILSLRRARRYLPAALILLCAAICALISKPRAALPAAGEAAVPVPIVMYHSVCHSPYLPPGDYLIAPETLESDLIALKEAGFESVFIADLIEFSCNHASLPRKPVVLTFDDGFLNAKTDVLPLLTKYGMKGAVSVVGEFTRQFSENPDPNPAYAYLTFSDVRELSESGVFEIGNHTDAMHATSGRFGAMKKPGESAEAYRAALRGDLEALQRELAQKSGVTPEFFAYPFGAVSEDSGEVIRALGFRASLSCREGINYLTGNPQELFGLRRFNRPAGISSAEFLRRLTAQE